MSTNLTYLEAHPFIGVSVVACVVSASATFVLLQLLNKGQYTKTMGDYVMIYLLLVNMAFVWAC